MSRFTWNWLIRVSFHDLTRQPRSHRPPVRIGQSPRLTIETLENRWLLSGGIREFVIPTPNSGPYGITGGPDGNVWFTQRFDGMRVGNIAKITPNGAITEYPIPSPGRWAESIAKGPDGNLWFADFGSNGIGQVTPGGSFIGHYPIDTSPGGPEGIAAGPDGNMWFAEYYGHKVGRITRDGVIREFTPPGGGCQVPGISYGCNPSYLTAGPDGNVWFTEAGGNKIGRVNLVTNPPGPIDITEFTIPTQNSNPDGITVGPDGNIWFTEQRGNKVGRLTPFGSDQEIQDSIRDFTVPAGFDHLYSITAGPDGHLWFVGYSSTSRMIGRMNTDGVVVNTFEVPTENPQLVHITAGPDGNIWFTENRANQIGKLYVLSATGLTLENAVAAGRPLQAVVANFRDDESDMLGSHYVVTIDWGDGEQSTGRAWTAGGGNWVATGDHTYARAGEYWMTVTITDTHAPTGMSATVVSYVSVTDTPGPGVDGPGGFLPDVLAALLREEPTPVALPSSETPATARSLDMLPVGTRFTPPENGLTPARVPARHADAWLGDVLVEVLTADLPAN